MLHEDEIEDFSRLVEFVFDEYVGKDYSETGNKNFKDYINPAAVLERMKGKSTFYVAKDEGWVIGALEIQNKNHISLFFVDKECQEQEIERELFERYLSDIEPGSISSVTVNSSIFGENVYTDLGFKRTGGPQEKDGILFIPMAYTLQ